MKAHVSEKGQVTIPKSIRKKLGLKAGSVIEFEERQGTIVGRKVPAIDDPVLEVTGIIKLGETVDEYLDTARGRAE